MEEKKETKIVPETVTKEAFDKMIAENKANSDAMQSKLDGFQTKETERIAQEKTAKEETLKTQNEWEKLAGEKDADLTATQTENKKLKEANEKYIEINEKRRLKKLDAYIKLMKFTTDEDKSPYQDMTELQLEHLIKTTEKTAPSTSAGAKSGTVTKDEDANDPYGYNRLNNPKDELLNRTMERQQRLQNANN